MAAPIISRVYLKYSGDANYLRLFIEELTKQYAESLEFDERMGYATAEAKVELNIPGFNIEWETDSCPALEA